MNCPTIIQPQEDDTQDTYILAPNDLFGVAVVPGDKMVAENDDDVFFVACSSCCPVDIFDKKQTDRTTFQEICYDADGHMYFADECIHYSDRHSLVAWCLHHPEDCGDFDRNV